MNKSDKILLALAVFIVTFIISMEVAYFVTGSVPDTLIQCTLGAGGVEALFLAAIKITNVIVEKKKQSDTQEDSYE